MEFCCIKIFENVHLEDQELGKEMERGNGCGWESDVEKTPSEPGQVICRSCDCSYIQNVTVIRI
jgi:hypothetical protein